MLPGANLHLDCYDSTTWTRCAGSWPQSVSGGPVWGPRSADGVIHNICANTQCFALDGSAHTLPPNFAAYLAANPVVGLSVTSLQVGNATSLGTKAAWTNTGDKSSCWDMATDAKCAAAFPITVSRVYTTVLDPEDPDCLWTNGDDGVIRNWKTSTGRPGLRRWAAAHLLQGGGLHSAAELRPGVPRLPVQVLQAHRARPHAVHLRQADGEGLQRRAHRRVDQHPDLLPRIATVDLTALTPAVAGSTPTFDVAAAGLTDTSVVPVGEFRVTTGSPPQLCWDLSVPALTCPTVARTGGQCHRRLPGHHRHRQGLVHHQLRDHALH